MANFVIGGISGVGKSFLESVMQKELGYLSNVKYTNRPYRPGEKGTGLIISLSDQEFDEMEHEFFPVIYQTGFRYGYKMSDVEDNDKRTVAVPVKDVMPHVNTMSKSLIPIILIVEKGNIDLLINRIKKREDFESKSKDIQEKILQNIDDRIEIALKEIQQAQALRTKIEEKKGRIFYIEDDETIFKEVLPYIATFE